MNSESLVFDVRYIGAKKHFHDPHASAHATLAHEKPEVLTFFALKETPNEAGGKIYILSEGGKPITDLSQTLGHLAHGKHELQLDLIEQLVQG